MLINVPCILTQVSVLMKPEAVSSESFSKNPQNSHPMNVPNLNGQYLFSISPILCTQMKSFVLKI